MCQLIKSSWQCDIVIIMPILQIRKVRCSEVNRKVRYSEDNNLLKNTQLVAAKSHTKALCLWCMCQNTESYLVLFPQNGFYSEKVIDEK